MTSPDDLLHLQRTLDALKSAGRYDVLLDVLGVPTLQQLNIEAARVDLSPLVITADFRFVLSALGREVELAPIHKALYILFLDHPEGIEFKRLSEHRDELLALYRRMANRVDEQKLRATVDRLVNPLDNSINEKCARIKAAFAAHVDEYHLAYYAISGHSARRYAGSDRLWFDRRKTITLPRHLVVREWEG